MPQPFKGEWASTIESVSQRPALAVHIAMIANMWATIEYSLGVLIAQILDAEAVVGTAMYLSLISENSRDAVLMTAAREKLSEDKFKEFEELIRALKGPRKMRNVVVHGLWATAKDRPDSLILVDHRKMARMFSYIHKEMEPLSDELKKYSNAIEEHANSALEYQEKDFERIERAIEEASGKLGAFSYSLMKPRLDEKMNMFLDNQTNQVQTT